MSICAYLEKKKRKEKKRKGFREYYVVEDYILRYKERNVRQVEL